MRAVHTRRRAQPRALFPLQSVAREAQHDRTRAQIPRGKHRLPHRRSHSASGQRSRRELQLYGRTPRRRAARHQGKEGRDESCKGCVQDRAEGIRGALRAHRKGYSQGRRGRQDGRTARARRDLSSAETGIQRRSFRLQGRVQTQTRQRGYRRIHRSRDRQVGHPQDAGQAGSVAGCRRDRQKRCRLHSPRSVERSGPRSDRVGGGARRKEARR